MKNSELMIVNLIESKINQDIKINEELLPLIADAEKLSEFDYKTLKRLGKKQSDNMLAVSNLLKTLKQ